MHARNFFGRITSKYTTCTHAHRYSSVLSCYAWGHFASG